MIVRRCEYTAAGLWALAAGIAATGLLFTVSFAGVGAALSVPLFVWLDRRGVIGRARHGMLLGAAAFPAWLAWLHRDYQRCPASPADMADGNWQCGGTDPAPFLAMTVVIVCAFAVVWLLSRSDYAHP